MTHLSSNPCCNTFLSASCDAKKRWKKEDEKELQEVEARLKARSSSKYSLTDTTGGIAPADTCSDVKIEDAPGPENELKEQVVIFVWVDVFNPAIGQVKLTANAPARFHDYLTDPASLAATNNLELFPCEAKKSCRLWPHLPLAELTTGRYSINSESF
jgi:hypothetical protein